jgi:sec-independent protein translocase protein TatA
MFGLGIPEIIIIALIILFLFGAKRIPDIGEGLGKTVREIGKIKKDLSKDKGSTNKKEEGEDTEPQSDPPGSKGPDSLQDKVTGQILDQVPVIKEAKKIKDKADKIKKIVS